MSRKKKRKEANNNFKKEKREEVYSPFSSIVLKEKKEEVKKPNPVSPPLKRPSQIVQGYDPNASFADILNNWEKTGELYALPKHQSVQRSEKKQSFGDILAAWEGKSAPKPKKNLNSEEVRVSPQYKATKDFGAILDQFEGKVTVKKVEAVNEVEKEKEEVRPVVKETEIENPFFKSKDSSDERPNEVAWSIFGDNKVIEREDKKEEQKVEEPKKEEKRISPSYTPSEDFGAILEKFEEKVVKQVTPSPVQEEIKSEVKKKEKGTTFFKHDSEEERPREVAWSVLGGNKELKRDEKSVEETPTFDFDNKRKIIQKSYKLFKKSVETIDVKTFEEILKEKGDNNTKRREKSINEIRMMMPESTLDLHGLTQSEAESEIKKFLAEASDNKLSKVAIIHGKGLHAEDGQGVLKDLTYALVSSSSLVREYTVPKAQYGGSGALWIILKKKKEAE